MAGMCEVAYAESLTWGYDRCGGDYKPSTMIGPDIEQKRVFEMNAVSGDNRLINACSALGLRDWLPMPFTSSHGALDLFAIRGTSKEWVVKFKVVLDPELKRRLGFD
ncbi:MAG TPA: hypothetical protein VM103_02080 [Candidatus Paceibacterota bacterium]|nr:hypothetical protein [Candidatus Paceibacterota bacterium]